MVQNKNMHNGRWCLKVKKTERKKILFEYRQYLVKMVRVETIKRKG